MHIRHLVVYRNGVIIYPKTRDVFMMVNAQVILVVHQDVCGYGHIPHATGVTVLGVFHTHVIVELEVGGGRIVYLTHNENVNDHNKK